VKIVQQTPELLELVIEIPRIFVWFMLAPLGLGGIIGLASLVGGEFLSGLGLLAVLAGLGLVGYYFLTEQTRVLLDGPEGKVRIRRTTILDGSDRQFPLAHLDGADVQHSRNRSSSDGSAGRSTSSLSLVFGNTRPATQVPLTRWAVSGGGAGMLANAINDWLRDWHDGQENRDDNRQDNRHPAE
jgi:hypothetical protein